MCLDPRPSNEKKKGKQSIVKEKIQGLSTKRWEGWRGKKRRRRRRSEVGPVGHGKTLSSSLIGVGASEGLEQSSDVIRFKFKRSL